MIKAITALYEGRVQGVGFRASILSLAREYDVTGWVKNLPDGRVKLFACGDHGETDGFLRGISESHLAGHIETVNLSQSTPEPLLKGFRILN